MFFVLILFASCERDINNNTTNPDEPDSMNDLVISDDFNFENTVDFSLEVILPTTVDYSEVHKRVEVLTMPEEDGGTLLYVGSADENGELYKEIRIPAYLDSLYINTFAGAGYVYTADAAKSTNDGGIIRFDYNEEYGTEAPFEIEEKTGLKKYVSYQNHVVAQNKSEKVVNIIGNPGFETNSVGEINYWTDAHSVDSKWYVTTYREQMSIIDGGSSNVMSTPTTSTFNNFVGGASQLIDASPGDVITLSADIKRVGSSYRLYSWIYIIPLNASGNPLAYYNVRYYNPSSSWKTKCITATMPSGTDKVNILLWANDYTSNSAVYFDNVVVTGPVTDQDNDGVDDDEDEYPTDPDRAFNIYYPAEDELGSLGFEDNWPGLGDYDFNDLVIDYNYHQVINADNELVEMFSDFYVRAIGASFENGFGIQLGTTSDKIQGVSGISVPGDYVNLAANYTEMGQEKATIVVFENAFDILNYPGSGIGVNTEQDQDYVEPVLMEVDVTMSEPVHVDEIGLAPFNPFIIIDQDRGREAHLPDYEPTTLVDESYFATAEDDSDPAMGRYYKTANNLPWALDVPAYYAYPIEKVEIIDAYNYFETWAQTEGAEYPDWYLDEAGYRNDANIYQEP